MKLHRCPETGSFYLEVRHIPGAEAREIVDGLIVDLDKRGRVVGVDIASIATLLANLKRAFFRAF